MVWFALRVALFQLYLYNKLFKLSQEEVLTKPRQSVFIFQLYDTFTRLSQSVRTIVDAQFSSFQVYNVFKSSNVGVVCSVIVSLSRWWWRCFFKILEQDYIATGCLGVIQLGTFSEPTLTRLILEFWECIYLFPSSSFLFSLHTIPYSRYRYRYRYRYR